MSFNYERDDAQRRITVTVVGETTFEQFLSIVERQAAEGTWQYSLLYEADALSAPATAHVRRMVTEVDRLSTEHGCRGPVAIVSARSEVYGTARMYSTLSEQHQVVAVFRTRADAETWLAAQPMRDDGPRS